MNSDILITLSLLSAGFLCIPADHIGAGGYIAFLAGVPGNFTASYFKGRPTKQVAVRYVSARLRSIASRKLIFFM